LVKNCLNTNSFMIDTEPSGAGSADHGNGIKCGAVNVSENAIRKSSSVVAFNAGCGVTQLIGTAASDLLACSEANISVIIDVCTGSFSFFVGSASFAGSRCIVDCAIRNSF